MSILKVQKARAHLCDIPIEPTNYWVGPGNATRVLLAEKQEQHIN